MRKSHSKWALSSSTVRWFTMLVYSENFDGMARARLTRIDPESPEAIAKRLRALRRALKKTQADMARMLDLSPRGQAWGNYETLNPRDWRRIELDRALRLCQDTAVTLDWIYRGNIGLVPPDLAEKIRYQQMKADEDEDLTNSA